MFDESLRTLQGEGGAVDLAPWYREGENSILHMVSVCGREEVALVDSSARVRIFSFLKLQFRFVSPPPHNSRYPCRAQQSMVDRRPCSSKLPPLPYTRHQMDLASLSFTLTIPVHRSPPIIWRHLAQLRVLP